MDRSPLKRGPGRKGRREASTLAAFRKAIRDRCRPHHCGYFICQVCGCKTTEIEAHHISKRRKGDHSPENGLGVCPACHLRIETNPKWAKEQGWSK